MAFSILVFNAYRENLGFELFAAHDHTPLESVIHGEVSDIGVRPSLEWKSAHAGAKEYIQAANYKVAAEWILDFLEDLWPFGSLLKDLGVVAYRCSYCSGELNQHALVMPPQRQSRDFPYQPGSSCIVESSLERFGPEVKVVMIFKLSPEIVAQDGREERQIASMALKALDTIVD